MNQEDVRGYDSNGNMPWKGDETTAWLILSNPHLYRKLIVGC
jgi:hypothetical protein